MPEHMHPTKDVYWHEQERFEDGTWGVRYRWSFGHPQDVGPKGEWLSSEALARAQSEEEARRGEPPGGLLQAWGGTDDLLKAAAQHTLQDWRREGLEVVDWPPARLPRERGELQYQLRQVDGRRVVYIVDARWWASQGYHGPELWKLRHGVQRKAVRRGWPFDARPLDDSALERAMKAAAKTRRSIQQIDLLADYIMQEFRAGAVDSEAVAPLCGLDQPEGESACEAAVRLLALGKRRGAFRDESFKDE